MKPTDKTNQTLLYVQRQLEKSLEAQHEEESVICLGSSMLYLERALGSWVEELCELVSVEVPKRDELWLHLKLNDWVEQSPELVLLSELLQRPDSWLFSLRSNLNNFEATLSSLYEQVADCKANNWSEAKAANVGNKINLVNVGSEDAHGRSELREKIKSMDQIRVAMKAYIQETRARQQEW